MSILDLFSKQQRRLRGQGPPDVYTYDSIPATLRVQIVHILMETLGGEGDFSDRFGTVQPPVWAYQNIVKALCREYGVFKLPHGDQNDGPLRQLVAFILQEKDCEKVLDAIQLSFILIDKRTRGFSYLSRSDASELADAAIEELNGRFKEHGVGYELQSGEIVRIDSQLVHQEVVRPALLLLSEPDFDGAQRNS
jgi:hypothetical protein